MHIYVYQYNIYETKDSSDIANDSSIIINEDEVQAYSFIYNFWSDENSEKLESCISRRPFPSRLLIFLTFVSKLS